MLVAEPASLVNTARTSQPFSKVPKTGPLNVSEVEVPLPWMFFQEAGPFSATCHTTVGSGSPLAVAVNLTVSPG